MAQQSKGTIVTYHLPDGPSKGAARAALVVEAHDASSTGTLDLYVFGNSRTDGVKYDQPLFVPAVVHGNNPGQWS